MLVSQQQEKNKLSRSGKKETPPRSSTHEEIICAVSFRNKSGLIDLKDSLMSKFQFYELNCEKKRNGLIGKRALSLFFAMDKAYLTFLASTLMVKKIDPTMQKLNSTPSAPEIFIKLSQRSTLVASSLLRKKKNSNRTTVDFSLTQFTMSVRS